MLYRGKTASLPANKAECVALESRCWDTLFHELPLILEDFLGIYFGQKEKFIP